VNGIFYSTILERGGVGGEIDQAKYIHVAATIKVVLTRQSKEMGSEVQLRGIIVMGGSLG